MDLNLEPKNLKKNDIFLDDLDIEDIPFTPITDGLGFNNKKSSLNMASKSMSKKRVNETHSKIYESVTSTSSKEIESNVPSELNAFYQAPKQQPQGVNKELKFEKVIKKECGLETRFWAWLMDSSIILGLLGVILGTMFTSTNMSMSEFKFFLMEGYNIIFPVLLFCLIYVLYHITTGFQPTIGQKAMRIKPDFDDIKGDIFFFLLKRSILELVSITTLGLIFILSFDKKILGNKVCTK